MRVLIMGAAGRDFHDFNTVFRGRDDVEVVAFTRAPGQNLGAVEETPFRRYPSSLAGPGYPDGIPIEPERKLESVIRTRGVDQVVFSYSDVSHQHVMHAASRSLGAGAGFRLIGPDSMMLDLEVPVLAVDAVRTGCGKSQTTRALSDVLSERGRRVRIVREPMPYGDLEAQAILRFESQADLDRADVTIEEREEYEQHIEGGHVVFAGVDYQRIADQAIEEADIIVWDGGNNELPFFAPDLHIVLADPLRPGDEVNYHPGETNARRADCFIVNKENSADESAISTVVENLTDLNPGAELIHAKSVVTVDDPERIRGATVLTVEDGPTLTHGEASSGAAAVAAAEFGAAKQIDPREAAVGTIADTLEQHPHIESALPAMGYTDQQVMDLETTITNLNPDLVLAGTPHDLSDQIDVDVPVVDVRYRMELQDTTFHALVDKHAAALGLD